MEKGIELISSLFTLLLNSFKNTSPFLRFLAIVATILFCWSLNDSLGLIRNYRISNKIEQIKNLEAIIQSPKIDPETKNNLQAVEKQIIKRESLLELLYLSLSENDSGNKKNTNGGQITHNNKDLNIFFHIISSSWLGIIFFFFCIYWAYVKRKSNIKIPAFALLLTIVNIVSFSLITLLFPKSENLIINYLVNALFYTVVQLILLLGLIPIIINKQQKIFDTLS